MSTPTPAPAPLKVVDSSVGMNLETIGAARSKLDDLRSKLLADFDADAMRIAGTYITNADVTRFSFDEFTAEFTRVNERFRLQKEAIEKFRVALRGAMRNYTKTHRDELIAVVDERIAKREEESRQQSEATAVAKVELEKLRALKAQLQTDAADGFDESSDDQYVDGNTQMDSKSTTAKKARKPRKAAAKK